MNLPHIIQKGSDPSIKTKIDLVPWRYIQQRNRMSIKVKLSDPELIERALDKVNEITCLMEDDQIEEAIKMIYDEFEKLPVFAKNLLTYNILQAQGQYDLKSVQLPDSFYDFICSHDSDELFFVAGRYNDVEI